MPGGLAVAEDDEEAAAPEMAAWGADSGTKGGLSESLLRCFPDLHPLWSLTKPSPGTRWVCPAGGEGESDLRR